MGTYTETSEKIRILGIKIEHCDTGEWRWEAPYGQGYCESEEAALAEALVAAEEPGDFNTMVAKIESEINRLDAGDSDTNICGICVDTDDLPEGWVRVFDGNESVFGQASEVLAVLKAVEYDPDAVVTKVGEPDTCYDPSCPSWHGEEPEAGSPYEHGHETEETVPRDNGWELAWEALSEFSNYPPEPEEEQSESKTEIRETK
jgi:hypothetical protein